MKHEHAFKTSRAANAINPKKTKSRLDLICQLRKEVAAWKARALGQKPKIAKPVIDVEARRKRQEERAAARAEHEAFLAKQADIKPKKDLALEKWEDAEKLRKRQQVRVTSAKWRAKNREKVNAYSREYQRAYKAKRKSVAVFNSRPGPQVSSTDRRSV
jgi:hypothetical protein